MRAHKPLELLQLPGVVDEHVLRHQVKVFEAVDGLAGVLDDPRVDQIQRGQVRLRRVAAHRVVVPGAVLQNRARRALRGGAQRGDPFGGLVGVTAHERDLRVDHLVDADEVGARDVPVHVLEREVKVVVGAELLLQ